MSRSNDGLPMLPPWLSEGDANPSGDNSYVGYETPVQNLPQDELIPETPPPRRGFFNRGSDDDSDSGGRRDKRRLLRRRGKDNHQSLEERVGELLPNRSNSGARPAPPSRDEWSSEQPASAPVRQHDAAPLPDGPEQPNDQPWSAPPNSWQPPPSPPSEQIGFDHDAGRPHQGGPSGPEGIGGPAGGQRDAPQPALPDLPTRRPAPPSDGFRPIGDPPADPNRYGSPLDAAANPAASPVPPSSPVPPAQDIPAPQPTQPEASVAPPRQGGDRPYLPPPPPLPEAPPSDFRPSNAEADRPADETAGTGPPHAPTPTPEPTVAQQPLRRLPDLPNGPNPAELPAARSGDPNSAVDHPEPQISATAPVARTEGALYPGPGIPDGSMPQQPTGPAAATAPESWHQAAYGPANSAGTAPAPGREAPPGPSAPGPAPQSSVPPAPGPAPYAPGPAPHAPGPHQHASGPDLHAPGPHPYPPGPTPYTPGPDPYASRTISQPPAPYAPGPSAPGPDPQASGAFPLPPGAGWQWPAPQQASAPPVSGQWAGPAHAAPAGGGQPVHDHRPPPHQQWNQPPPPTPGGQWQGPPQGQPGYWPNSIGPGGPVPGGLGSSLDDVPLRRAKRAPGSGWRKAVHHVSRGAINPGMSAEERRLQELVARIRQPVRGDYRIAVLSLKGGVGKTTTTMGIGSTFASIRGDRVIAVDANPDFGTLSQRVPLQTRSTVRDLLLDPAITRYSDVRRHTSQSSSRLEVLAGERDPAASEAFSEAEYRAVARILQRFYNIILTDCGTGLMHSAMTGVLDLAHSLVLISSPAIDGARSAAATLDWLSLHGHDHLVRNAVVVINCPRDGSPNVGIQQLREYFLTRCRAVHVIPFDPHLSEGAEIDLPRLHKNTKRAYVELAATVADDFATDHRRFHQ